MIRQKIITINFLTKKKKINEGEVPQYYVENSHPAIISPETFDLVQEEIKRRKTTGKYTSGVSCFASKIICKECGSFYGRKIWHSNSKYSSNIWQCNNKFKNKKRCGTVHLREENIEQAFVNCFNEILDKREEIIAVYNECLNEITDLSKEIEQGKFLEEKMELLRGDMEKLIMENSRRSMDQEEYNNKYNLLHQKYKKKEIELESVHFKIEEKSGKQKLMISFLDNLKNQEKLLTEFDESLWSATVNNVIVGKDSEMLFCFKDGREVLWKIIS